MNLEQTLLDTASIFLDIRVSDKDYRKKFKGKYLVRQLVPGQVALTTPLIVKDKVWGISTDLFVGKSEFQLKENTMLRVFSSLADAAKSFNNLDKAIDHVKYWTTGVKAIIGTDASLGSLSDEITYRDIPIVPIDSSIYNLPNSVLVVGESIGEFVLIDTKYFEDYTSSVNERTTPDITAFSCGLILWNQEGLAKV